MEVQVDHLGKVAITIEQDYYDPTKDYDKLTVVEVEDRFTTYISRKPVPAGTSIDNREYWIPFSTQHDKLLQRVETKLNNFTPQVVMTKEEFDVAAEQQLLKDDTLYYVLSTDDEDIY